MFSVKTGTTKGIVFSHSLLGKPCSSTAELKHPPLLTPYPHSFELIVFAFVGKLLQVQAACFGFEIFIWIPAPIFK